MTTRLEKEWAGLPESWKDRLSFVNRETWFHELGAFLDSELDQGNRIFPPEGRWLQALHSLPLEKVRVVVLGQDPYHGEGQALGIAFAVPNSLHPKPPSLVNILKEVASDTGSTVDVTQSDLSHWQEDGVLLLNTALTVRESQPLSHRNRGWEKLTDEILRLLDSTPQPIVFLLWGAPAQKKRALLRNPVHLVLEAPHPSPLSAYRGFLGCRHFTQANEYLKSHGLPAVRWAGDAATKRG